MTDPKYVTIAGSLVRYLRTGAKSEMRRAIDILQVELDTSLTPATFRSALARFDDSRTLLEMIGLVDEARQADLELDLARSPQLVLKTLASEYDKELQRIQDACACEIEIPARDLRDLERLLAEVRSNVGNAAKHPFASPATATLGPDVEA